MKIVPLTNELVLPVTIQLLWNNLGFNFWYKQITCDNEGKK